MSTNIRSFKVKTILLGLPLTFDFQQWLGTHVSSMGIASSAGVKWCIEEESEIQANLAKSTWKLSLSGQELSGVIQDNKLLATQIELSSDSSSHIYSDVILPLFEECNGILEDLVVWEDGS